MISSDMTSAPVVTDGALGSLCPSLSKLCMPKEIAASVSIDMATMSRLTIIRQHVALLCPVISFLTSSALIFLTAWFAVSFSDEDGLTCGRW